MALFETTFPWTSHVPQPCYFFIFFPLLLFILFPFKVSPSQMQLMTAPVWTLEKQGRWRERERELTNKQSWSHRLNHLSCNHFLRSSIMKRNVKPILVLLNRSTAVNYIIHGLLIIQRMCLGRIVWPCFLCNEITACKKRQQSGSKTPQNTTLLEVWKFHLAEWANSWPQSTLQWMAVLLRTPFFPALHALHFNFLPFSFSFTRLNRPVCF